MVVEVNALGGSCAPKSQFLCAINRKRTDHISVVHFSFSLCWFQIQPTKMMAAGRPEEIYDTGRGRMAMETAVPACDEWAREKQITPSYFTWVSQYGFLKNGRQNQRHRRFLRAKIAVPVRDKSKTDRSHLCISLQLILVLVSNPTKK